MMEISKQPIENEKTAWPDSNRPPNAEAGHAVLVYVNLPAHRAAYVGDVQSLPSIFQKEGVPMLDVSGNTPLHVAAKNGKGDCIRWLLTHTCIPKRAKNKHEETAAHVAATYGNIKCLQMLLTTDENPLDAACDRNADRMTTLHLATVNGHVPVAMWLLMEYKGTIAGMRTKSGMAVLHIASEKGMMEIVKLMTKLGPKLITSRDNKGQTPLHHAAKNGQLQCLKYMVEHGQLNPRSLRSFNRATPLHAAAVGGHLETLKWVVAKMGPLMIIDKMDGGITPLHIVAGRGHVECMKWMINQQTTRKVVDVRDNQGRTPAYYAAEMGKVTCLSLLVDEGADVHTMDKHNQTPYMLAIQGGNKECNMYAMSLTGGQVIDPKFVGVSKATGPGEQVGTGTPTASRPVVSPIIALRAMDEDIMRNFRSHEREMKHRGKKKSKFPKSRSLSRERKNKINLDEKKSASVGTTGGKAKNSVPKAGAKSKGSNTSSVATATTPTPLRQLFHSTTNRTIALPDVDDEQQLRSRQHFFSNAVRTDNLKPPKYNPGESSLEDRRIDEHGDNWTLKKKGKIVTTSIVENGSEANSVDAETSTLGDSFNWVDTVPRNDVNSSVPTAQNHGYSTSNAEGTIEKDQVAAEIPEPDRNATRTVVTTLTVETKSSHANFDFSPPSSPEEVSEHKIISIEAMVHRQNSEKDVDDNVVVSSQHVMMEDVTAPSTTEEIMEAEPIAAVDERSSRADERFETNVVTQNDERKEIRTLNVQPNAMLINYEEYPSPFIDHEARNETAAVVPPPPPPPPSLTRNVRIVHSTDTTLPPANRDARVENREVESLHQSRSVRIVQYADDPSPSVVRDVSIVSQEPKSVSRDVRLENYAETRPPHTAGEFRIEKSARYRPPSISSDTSETSQPERRRGRVNNRILQLMSNFERGFYGNELQSSGKAQDIGDVSRTWLSGQNETLDTQQNNVDEAGVLSDGEDYGKYDGWPKNVKKGKKQVRFLTPSKERMMKLEKSRPPNLPDAPDVRESHDEVDHGLKSALTNGHIPPPPKGPPPNLLLFDSRQNDLSVTSPRESTSSLNDLISGYDGRNRIKDSVVNQNVNGDNAERFRVSSNTQEKHDVLVEALRKRFRQPADSYPELK
ncbi:uncharacterized protein [Ptychodera flava]|uniref:uncharacterized protein n=1 Tax=Ptychodera flava TaxID=63121 RepID=UPI00396A9D47